MSRPFHSSNAFIEGVAASEQVKIEIPPATAGNQLDPKTRFGYLFKYKDSDRLETNSKTVLNLMELGASMREEFIKDSNIPSVYTYFGQFIAHDITFDPIAKDIPLHKDMVPLTPDVVESLQNRRTGLLDLDSVYGPGFDDVGIFEVPRNSGDKEKEMKLGVAYTPINPVAGTDLPRKKDPPYEALIGDPRNDENLPVSQLHVAFLRAHNQLVANRSFVEAQSLLKHRYQHLVVNDFLPKLVSKGDIDTAVAKKELYSPPDNDFFMPIEFTAAAFRFGHSMIRSKYEFNKHRGEVSLSSLFTREAMGDYFQILADWVIDWSHFVDGGSNKARAFFPQLVEPLEKLLDRTRNLRFSLAVNDLLRGYLLGLPTGQALAETLKVKDAVTEDEILKSAISPKQKEILEVAGFHKATPLWFYLFAEAQQKRDGNFLGPVCGQLVALVLLELARRSNYQDDGSSNETLSQFVLSTLT